MIRRVKSAIVHELEFDNELVYNKIFLTTKIKFYYAQATNFCDDKMPKKGVNYICLAVILIDFVLKRVEKYQPQLFLKES